jgi:hypothetical protein
MAEDQPSKSMPAYFPWRTFESTTEGFAASGGVPSKLDRSVLSTMSGSGRSAFLVGLRFLNLVDDDNHPRPLLEKYVAAEGEDKKLILAEILRDAYGFLTDGSIDIKRATASQLSEAMGKAGATTSTREKAVAFLLKALEATGATVSPHILKRKHTPSSSPKPRTPKPKKSNPGQDGAERGDGRGDGFQAAPAAQKPSSMLLEHFMPNEMDNETQNAIWTLIKYFKGKDL